MLAAGYGHVGMVELFLKDGQNANAKHNDATALVIATYHGRKPMIEMLLENRADPWIKTDGKAVISVAKAGVLELILAWPH